MCPFCMNCRCMSEVSGREQTGRVCWYVCIYLVTLTLWTVVLTFILKMVTFCIKCHLYNNFQIPCIIAYTWAIVGQCCTRVIGKKLMTSKYRQEIFAYSLIVHCQGLVHTKVHLDITIFSSHLSIWNLPFDIMDARQILTSKWSMHGCLTPSEMQEHRYGTCWAYLLQGVMGNMPFMVIHG